MPTDRRWSSGLALVLFATLAVVATVAAARAETLILKDGTKIEGRIINRNAQLITIEVEEGGRKKEKIVIASRVLKIEGGAAAPDAGPEDPAKPATTDPPKPAPVPATPAAGTAAQAPPAAPKPRKGSGYCVVPIHKTLGVDNDWRLLEKALDACAKEGPQYIVIEIDSVGGLLKDGAEIAVLLMQWQDKGKLPLAAYVTKNAHAGAAMVALSVRRLYMAPGSSLGAAAPWLPRSGGSLSKEDLQIDGMRIMYRGAAESAGRNLTVVDAMIDADHALTLISPAGGGLAGLLGAKADIRRGTPAEFKAQPGGAEPQLLVEKGKHLQLTASEAVRVGAAAGVAKDYDELGKLLGQTGWQPVSDVGIDLVQRHMKAVDAAATEYGKTVQRVKDAQGAITRATARDITAAEPAVLAAKTALARIEKLVQEHPFLGSRLKADFPNGLAPAKASFESLLAQIREARKAKSK